jgi:RNA methyltransferase, TrmH family
MPPSYAPGPGDDPAVRDRAMQSLEGAVTEARGQRSTVLLEGVHALKHAVRFGAAIHSIATPDRAQLRRLLAELAPDVELPVDPVEVDDVQWRRLVPRELPSPVVSVAARPAVTAQDALADRSGRVVILEGPRHLGNLGAAIRVAAAAEAAGLIVVGEADPWHPTAVRAAAGLQYALPVARVSALPETFRPIVAIDPGGRDLTDTEVPADALLLFGTERGGLSEGLRRRADQHVAIPMRDGVSSLNLATAVGITLYVAAAAG